MPKRRRASRKSGPILLIEDDYDFRSALEDALSATGVDVVAAGDRARALQILQTGARPSAIILDLIMPGMDIQTFERGLKVLQLLSVPVIVISCSTRYEIPTPMNATKRLMKPISFTDLISTIKSLAPGALPPPNLAAVES